jgi:hypothetical protein
MDSILASVSQKALTGATPTSTTSTSGTSSSSFQKVLDFQSAQGQGDGSTQNLMNFVDNTFGAQGDNMTGVDASSIHVEVNKASEVEKGPNANHIADLLQDFNKDQLQFENLKEMVTSGRTFKPQELIAMQVGVQHLTLQLEMVTKFGEGLVRVPNTIINMNFG